jgi:Protein of unknown function (DUF1698)
MLEFMIFVPNFLVGGRTFDLVFLGSLLMHVRDPIGALMAVRSVCKGRIISNTLMLDRDLAEIETVPIMKMLANDKDCSINWWQPNKSCVIKWFKAAGFPQVQIEKTVNLTTDVVYADEKGVSSGCNQTLYLVDASVSDKKLEVATPQSPIQEQPETNQAVSLEPQQQLQITKLKLLETEKKLQMFQDLLMAIESSKFWKLRQSWLDFKRKLNLKVDDDLYQKYSALIGRKSLDE